MNPNDKLTPVEQRLAAQIKAAYEPYRLAESPLRRRRPVRLWLASLAVVAAAVVVGAVVLQPSSALATWTREPTSSELGAFADATEDACRNQAANWQRIGARAGWPDDPGTREMARLPLVAYDQRGEAAAALFADAESRSAAICVIIPVAAQPAYVELGASTDLIPEDLGPVSIWMATAGSNWDYGSRWEVAGRVSSTIDELIIVRADGERVTATIDDGWFLAWWPAASEPVQIEVVVDDEAETIDLGNRYDSGGPPCRVVLFDRFCIWSY
jgi:hypothetical protein